MRSSFFGATAAATALLLLGVTEAVAGSSSSSPSSSSAASTATFIGCFDTSSKAWTPSTFRVGKITSLDDCMTVCNPSFGMNYGFWDESSSTCRCDESAKSVKALVAEAQEGVCPDKTSAGFAIDQPYNLVSCISSPNDVNGRSALTTSPIRISAPDECFTHCAGSDWTYMVPLPSTGEYYCGCSRRYVEPGQTTRCGQGSWYVFEAAPVQAQTLAGNLALQPYS